MWQTIPAHSIICPRLLSLIEELVVILVALVLWTVISADELLPFWLERIIRMRQSGKNVVQNIGHFGPHSSDESRDIHWLATAREDFSCQRSFLLDCIARALENHRETLFIQHWNTRNANSGDKSDCPCKQAIEAGQNWWGGEKKLGRDESTTPDK